MVMIRVKNKRLLVGLLLLLLFCIGVIVISLQYGVRHERKEQLKLTPEMIDVMTKDEIRLNVEAQHEFNESFSLFQVIPVIAFVGLLIGLIEYYLIYGQITQQERSQKKNAKILLRFLTSPERKIIKHLVENRGRSNQFNLSHLQGMNKFKTHRLINSLEEKDIIIKEKIGKINRIILKRDIYDLLI